VPAQGCRTRYARAGTGTCPYGTYVIELMNRCTKTPELVRQEFYGLMMAHFAVRGLMHEAALEADIDPDELSFVHSVRVVRRKLPLFVAIPPQRLKAFHKAVLEEILEERVASSRGRRNTRGVKQKMSNYPIRPRCQPCTSRLHILKHILVVK